jgi:hypothetical protein
MADHDVFIFGSHPDLSFVSIERGDWAIPVREWAPRAVGAPVDHNLRGWVRFLCQAFSKDISAK